MSARDPIRSACPSQSDSQSKLDFDIFSIFSHYETPVCIRDSKGFFVYSNEMFSEYIKGYEYDSAFWFDRLPVDLKCNLLMSELDALSDSKSVVLNNLIIDTSFHWYVFFQRISIHNVNFIVWVFIKDVFFNDQVMCKRITKDFIVKGVGNPALILEPGVYQNFCLYFSGFSHEFISNLLGVTLGTSKKRVSKAYALLGTSGRDEMILYLKVNSFLHGVQNYAFELIGLKYRKKYSAE